MSNWEIDDTIAAIASAPAGARRGIIRISGPDALEVCDRVVQLDDSAVCQFSLCGLTSTTTVKAGIEIAGALMPGQLLVWPTRRSYTRQPTVEFHTIGSPPLLQNALGLFCRNGARMAEPGEFTLRAFLSGRIDLTQAEAVLGVIDSSGSEQLSDALRQLAGGMSRPLDEIRTTLINILAELEAGLDFVEEDIEFISDSEIRNGLDRAGEKLQQLIDQIGSRDNQLHLPQVVLVGPPNAGKSSLFNALVGTGAAIVADVSGTTRDFVTAHIRCREVMIELVDTAGLEGEFGERTAEGAGEAIDSIPDQAQAMSGELLCRADVLVVCLPDGTGEEEFKRFYQSCGIDTETTGEGRVDVTTKCDLTQAPATSSEIFIDRAIKTSSHTGSGLSPLRSAIAEQLQHRITGAGSGIVASTAVRAIDSLNESFGAVRSARDAAESGIGLEVVASEIRRSLDALGCVIGTVYTDDILDRIFSQFCVGK